MVGRSDDQLSKALDGMGRCGREGGLESGLNGGEQR